MKQWLAAVNAWDQRASAQMARLAGCPSGRKAAWLLAHSGDSQWWLLAGAGFWAWGAGAWRTAGAHTFIVTLLAGAISGLLKRLFQRPRPEGGRQLLYFRFDRHSFPSGHAVRMGALVAILSPLLPWWGAATLALWGLGVCASRVALGVHYAADVAAGVLFGLLLGGLVLPLFPLLPI